MPRGEEELQAEVLGLEELCEEVRELCTASSKPKNAVAEDESNGSAPLIYFGSDNMAGVSPEVLKVLEAVNIGQAAPYGADSITKTAQALVREELGLGPDCGVYFVHTGTSANILALKAVLHTFDSVICASSSHLVTHETGALAAITGSTLLPLPSADGKITPEAIEQAVKSQTMWGPHATRPRVVSLSQPTEVGTVYRREEIQAISALCKKLGLLLHMDGCRLYNAAASLSLSDSPLSPPSLASLTKELGVDVLSLGGTKNGLMMGECVVFLSPSLGENFPYIHKQALHLQSKMRFLSAQFLPFFRLGLWRKNALHSNSMAKLLGEGLLSLGFSLLQPVESNMVFAELGETVKELQKRFVFYVMEEKRGRVRLVTSPFTLKNEVEQFLSALSASRQSK